MTINNKTQRDLEEPFYKLKYNVYPFPQAQLFIEKKLDLTPRI